MALRLRCLRFFLVPAVGAAAAMAGCCYSVGLAAVVALTECGCCDCNGAAAACSARSVAAQVGEAWTGGTNSELAEEHCCTARQRNVGRADGRRPAPLLLARVQLLVLQRYHPPSTG